MGGSAVIRPTFPSGRRHVVHLTARITEVATKYDDMVSNRHSKDLRYGCPITIAIKAPVPLRSGGSQNP
ncbi:hypothetical protein BHE74_00010137 [Ensete ventricosum]|nr:hypothetical protein BHE74_00010137 [Ensete ventricosum]RZR98749.1 hypothetical protein BHM03_00028177 [Ensete ventricosum]